FTREYPDLKRSVFLIFLLLPSVLFWGSGLLKDSLVFFAMGLSLMYFDLILYEKHKKTERIIILVMSLFLLMITKFQVFLLTVPLLVAWYIAYRYKVNALISFLTVSICFFIIVYLVQFLVPQADMIRLLANKQQAFIILAHEAGAGSIISIPVLEPTLTSVLINAPLGFFIC